MSSGSEELDTESSISRENNNNYDEEVMKLSEYLRGLNFKKEKSRRDVRKDKQLLQKLREEIAKKESFIWSNEKHITTCELRLKKALKARQIVEAAKDCQKIATPYKITSFN